MDILKWVWRVVFLVAAIMWLAPLGYMQYAFSASSMDGLSAWSLLSMLHMFSMPLLIWIPVEVFFSLHRVLTSE